MTIVPIRYVEPVYRPPSEADSLILPVTDGCSWNRCTFCDMYTAPQKKFRPRDEAEVLDSIRSCGEQFGRGVQRIFLADGDALTLSTRRLVTILEAIRRELPGVRRISSYCLPRNLRKKSVEELRELAELGLSMVYVGAESGDDEVLAKISKGETFASTLDALNKLQQAGIKRSVMILNGLGGETLTQQHALNSARLMNEAQPEFLATLVVSLPEWRNADARTISRMDAAGRCRPDAGNGASALGAGPETHSLPQRPRLELAGAEGDARRRQAATVAGIARCDRGARRRARCGQPGRGGCDLLLDAWSGMR